MKLLIFAAAAVIIFASYANAECDEKILKVTFLLKTFHFIVLTVFSQ